MITSLAASTFETIINRYLKLDPEVSGRLVEFSGKAVAIEFNDLPISLLLSVSDTGFQVISQGTQEPDTILRGNSWAMIQLGLSQGAKSAVSMFSGDVEIEGDVELGQGVKRIFDDLRIDWEEQLAKFTGDIVAHQVGNVVRGTLDWGSETANAMCMNTTEYLQEEARHLPPREEVEDFFSDIDQLRNDVERLQVRYERLKTKMRN